MNNIFLVNWVSTNVIERKTINYDFDTSHIRLAFEKDTHKYASNDEVNEVMRDLGYHSTGYDTEPYLNFNISSESPALIIYRNEILGSH
jgi:hypothetical protein